MTAPRGASRRLAAPLEFMLESSRRLQIFLPSLKRIRQDARP